MDNQYAGMTVNERLYVSGLSGEFDKAVIEKNTAKVVEILKQVGLTEKSSVIPILDRLGLPY